MVEEVGVEEEVLEIVLVVVDGVTADDGWVKWV